MSETIPPQDRTTGPGSPDSATPGSGRPGDGAAVPPPDLQGGRAESRFLKSVFAELTGRARARRASDLRRAAAAVPPAGKPRA
jgi:hypothetical protein